MFNFLKTTSIIKNFLRRRIVLISIENFNREFAGKEILSKTFAKSGYLVLLAHKSIIRVLVSYLPLNEQIYIEKGNRFGSYKHFYKAKKNKLFVYSFDEEGLMQTDFDTYLQRNHEKKTLAVIDGIFSWGPKHSKMLRKCGFKENQILKTGNTRFDHYIAASQINRFSRDLTNDTILICSRFATANPNKDVNSIKDERDGSQKYAKDSKKILNLMVQLPKIIRQANIKNKIIVRPHPSESKKLWHEACHGLDNVTVSCEEPINDVLQRAKFLIHNRCTTAIEAFLSNVYVISYEPIKLTSPPNPDKEFINLFANYICKSNQELLESLNCHDIDNINLEVDQKQNEFIYNLNELSSVKIVQFLSQKHFYKINNNLFSLVLIIFSLPIIVLHHSFFLNIYKIFRKKYYAYLVQKNGIINTKRIFKLYKKFMQIRIFSKITIFIPI